MRLALSCVGTSQVGPDALEESSQFQHLERACPQVLAAGGHLHFPGWERNMGWGSARSDLDRGTYWRPGAARRSWCLIGIEAVPIQLSAELGESIAPATPVQTLPLRL